jgi:flagellar protein FlbD
VVGIVFSLPPLLERVLLFNKMIVVHRLNGKEFVVNCELIKYVESTPDTMITLAGGEKIMVKESVPEVIEATKKYKQEVFHFPAGRS